MILMTSIEASVPNTPGDYIGVTAIDKTSVRINFLDNSDNEKGFRILGEDINISIPAHDENQHPYVYANITGLACNKIYFITASAYNEDGSSESTNTRAFNLLSTFGLDCGEVDLTNGLVGHYEFEYNALDSSGNDNHGTEHGIVTYVDGAIDKAAHFDNSYLTIPSSYSLVFDDEFSLSAFVHPTSTDGEWVNLFFGAANLLNLNEYNFITWIFKNNQLKIYLNGTLLGTQNIDSNSLKQYITRAFEVGDDSPRAKAFFKGEVDDVRLYDRALNQEEINALYQLAQ